MEEWKITRDVADPLSVAAFNEAIRAMQQPIIIWCETDGGPDLMILSPKAMIDEKRELWLNKMARLGHHGRRQYQRARREARRLEHLEKLLKVYEALYA